MPSISSSSTRRHRKTSWISLKRRATWRVFSTGESSNGSCCSIHPNIWDGYAANNPLRWTDSNGLFSCCGGISKAISKRVSDAGNAVTAGVNEVHKAGKAVQKCSEQIVKLSGGLFQRSPEQIFSRFTRESSQTGLGLGLAAYQIATGNVKEVSYCSEEIIWLELLFLVY